MRGSPGRSWRPGRGVLAGALTMLGLILLALKPVLTQDAATPSVAPSSDLSSALPPNEWSRIESSVDAGLRWLAAQQTADGQFPSEPVAQPAVTSLAIMAFLSRGHVPDHGPYGVQLSRAIDFVLSTQKRQGYFSLLPLTPGGGEPNTSQTVHYNHAIAGLMLGEVYGMTTAERSRQIEDALAKALNYARKQYFDEGLDFVERCFVHDPAQRELGVFSYLPAGAPGGEMPSVTLANTASAMLTLILGGRHDSEMVRAGTEWFRTRDYPRPWQKAFFYLGSYYSSQAMAQVGGETWNQVYPQIARQMLDEQAADGSWPLGIGHERNYGSTYTTSLAVLALTPAYQLLPIFQR